MATVSKWNPFGVALDVTATAGSVVRKSATQFTVVINASWETYYSGAATNYGMSASSGGVTKTISSFGTSRSSGSASFTGTYSISGNGAQTKSITVTFTNFNTDYNKSASKNVTFNVSVPAWTSYTVKYNANGGSGAPGSQTKWKDQNLTLSSTKPTRTGYSFQGWNTSKTATTATYSAGGTYSANAGATLYAVWKANTYKVTYNANGGTLDGVASQTKTYGVALKLTGTASRTNYNFLGWATSASATKATYAAGANYTNNSNVTLYAVWELAYVKPRITGLSIYRVDDNGNSSDTGTSVLVKFNWECDYNVDGNRIAWSPASEGDYIDDLGAPTGTSGTVNEVIDSFTFSTETTYTFTVTVTDTYGSSTKTVTLPGAKFAIDILAQCKGIAFNKPAELEGVADIGFQTRFFGGILHMVLEPETDLNDIRTPNTYIGANISSYNYVNCPLTSGTFTLEVIGAGEEGQVKQRIQTCSKDQSKAYERYYYSGSWGDWVCVSDYDGALLWEGGMYMTSGHVITLPEAISMQRAGIILIFSEYIDGAVANQSFHTRFIPKMIVSKHSGSAQCIQLSTSNLAYFATKYLYITDTQITGHDNNGKTGTGTCGITYTNNRFVLRYVIGV